MPNKPIHATNKASKPLKQTKELRDEKIHLKPPFCHRPRLTAYSNRRLDVRTFLGEPPVGLYAHMAVGVDRFGIFMFIRTITDGPGRLGPPVRQILVQRRKLGRPLETDDAWRNHQFYLFAILKTYNLSL